MIGKSVVVLGTLLLAALLSACGTIEVDLANEAGLTIADVTTTIPVVETNRADSQDATPQSTTTIVPTAEPTATRLAEEVELEETAVPAVAVGAVTAGWQRFYDAEFGIELWTPPGTVAEVGEPARPEFWSAEFPDGIIEEQVFVVRVIQEAGGPFGPPGPQAILELKLVANAEGRSIGVAADLFSKRCPGPLLTPPQPTTVNVQLSGYRFACEGIDGIVFNELWSPYPGAPELMVGAAWTDMCSPL